MKAAVLVVNLMIDLCLIEKEATSFLFGGYFE